MVMRKTPPKSKFAEIRIMLGGSKMEQAPVGANYSNVFSAYIDNPGEAGKVEARFKKLGITTFKLGIGKTSFSLFENISDEDVLAALEATANMSVHSGLGARPGIARRAAELLVESQQFRTFVESLSSFISVATNGSTELIRIRIFGSFAGAVAAGVANIIVAALIYSLKQLNLTIECYFDLLGPTTFVQQNQRAAHTAACAMASIIAEVLRKHPKDENLVCYYVRFHELVPTTIKRQRDEWLKLDAQAMQSSQLEQELALCRPNSSGSSRFGNLTKTETEYFNPLHPANQVVPGIAQAIYPELQSAIAGIESAPILIDEFWVEDNPAQNSEQLFADALNSVNRKNRNETYAKLTAFGNQHSLRALVRLKTGELFDLSTIKSAFSSSPTSLANAVYRISQLETFSSIVTEELQTAKSNASNLADELDSGMAHEFKKAHSSAFSRLTIFGKAKRKAYLAELSQEARAKADFLQLNMELADLLGDIEMQIESERASQEAALLDIVAIVDSFLPRNKSVALPQLVTVVDQELWYPTISKMVGLDRDNQILAMAQLADTVTRTGLAAILGVSREQDDVFADEIVFGAPTVVAPPLGGAQRSDKPTVAYVLPKMNREDQEAIRHAIELKNPDAPIAFTDTISFGINVLRISIFQIESVEELFAGHFKHKLAQSLASPFLPLNLPNATEVLNVLGIRLVNGQIEFESQNV